MNLFGLHFYLFPQMMNLLVGTFSNFFLPLLWVKYIETSLSDLTVWKHQHKAFKTQNPTFFLTISCWCFIWASVDGDLLPLSASWLWFIHYFKSSEKAVGRCLDAFLLTQSSSHKQNDLQMPRFLYYDHQLHGCLALYWSVTLCCLLDNFALLLDQLVNSLFESTVHLCNQILFTF